MKAIENKIAFDYDVFPPEVRERILDHVQHITGCVRRVEADTLEIGRRLLEIHQAFQDARQNGIPLAGGFKAWCNSEFAWGDGQAYNFIRIAERFGDHEELVPQFDRTAMVLLSQKGTPSAARQESIEMAQRGIRVNYSRAKRIVENHRADKTAPIGPAKRELPAPTVKSFRSVLEELAANWKGERARLRQLVIGIVNDILPREIDQTAAAATSSGNGRHKTNGHAPLRSRAVDEHVDVAMSAMSGV